jgi:hypothetical protein
MGFILFLLSIARLAGHGYHPNRPPKHQFCDNAINLKEVLRRKCSQNMRAKDLCERHNFNKEEKMKKKLLHLFAIAAVGLACIAGQAAAADKKPNIVIIWGDDIGLSDVSAYSQGLMGFKTPNIDRVAKDHSAMPPASSARTIWGTATSSSPPCMALTSSTAISIT